MLKPRVSVVIPTYNRQKLLLDAIDSVLAQKYKDFEVIVVDDGSTDDTEERLRSYLGRVRYIKQKNQGVAAARNAGIRHAKGEYLCFLDSDDIWLPEKLSTQIAFADEHPQYGLIATEIQGIDENKKQVGINKAAKYSIRNGYVADDLLFGNWIQTSTVMVPSHCLGTVGCFDEDVGQFGEDWLMWMRIAVRYPIYFLPEPLVLYRYHQESLSSRQSEGQYRSLMRCVDKLSLLPYFQKKPKLLRKLEYNICIGRAWRDRESGEYEQALQKLQRASRLTRFPLFPWVQMARTLITKKFNTNRPIDSNQGS